MPSARTWTLSWTLATALGLAVGLPVSLALTAPIEAVVGMILVTPLILALAGSFLGTSQWLVLRRKLAGSGSWILMTTLGLGAGLTVGIVGVEVGGELLTGRPTRIADSDLTGLLISFTVVGTVTGFFLGTAQWLFFRRRQLAAPFWILVCILAFGLSFPIGVTVAELLIGGLRSPVGLAAFLLTIGLLIGVATAQGIGRGPLSAAAPGLGNS